MTSQETKKLTPFDFANAASHTKEDLFIVNADAEKDYSAFMVNKIFSWFDDCIFFANDLNLHYQMPPRQHFDYLRGGVRSKRRFAKWVKPDNTEQIKIVQVHYQCSPRAAEQYLELLSQEDLEMMKARQDKGGLSKTTK